MIRPFCYTPRRKQNMYDKQLLMESVNEAVSRLEKAKNLSPKIGLILGTGWGDLLTIDGEETRLLRDLPGFSGLGTLEGHRRALSYGTVAGKPVGALRGRVHMNEHPCDPRIPFMVRAQVELLIALGVKTLILTAAVGSLRDTIRVGDVVLIRGLISVFAQTSMPLFAGEFVSPEDALSNEIRTKAIKVGHAGLTVHHEGIHAFVRGPFFEGRRCDKKILQNAGADIVGMSILPETCVAATHEHVRVLALGFVTNSAIEAHSHETNQARAKEKSALLGGYLAQIVSAI